MSNSNESAGIDLEVLRSLIAVETAEQIAAKWKSILILGILNVVTGIFCLWIPTLASVAVELFLVATVMASGLLHLLWGCSAEPGHQSDFYLLGGAQVIVAVLMYLHPYFTLTVLTFIVAVLFMMLGATRLTVARNNPDMPLRSLMFLSGVSAIALSVFICLFLPVAKWFTIGLLLGVNLINIGVARIALALQGRQLASSSNGEYSSILPTTTAGY
jgi:uncharacterized membrane protein HdeD (DUF308 family)